MAHAPIALAGRAHTHNGLHQTICHPPRDLPMTAQERDQLQQFLAALRQQSHLPKDALAEGLIRGALAQQPDAPYWLVQRSLALQLALNAAQARLAQLQTQCDAQAARGHALASDAAIHAAGATRPADAGAGAAPVEDARVQPAPMAPALPSSSSPWGRGLLAQVSSTALGVTTGVVAGGLLLQGLQGLWGSDASSPGSIQGSAGGLSAAELDAADGAWDLGDDWA